MTRYLVKLINTKTRRYTAVFVSAKSTAEAEAADEAHRKVMQRIK